VSNTPDDCDGDERVNGDIHGNVEKELIEFAGSVTNEPVVGGEVVCHERYTDHQEDDVSHRQIQQQQVYGRPHLDGNRQRLNCLREDSEV